MKNDILNYIKYCSIALLVAVFCLYTLTLIFIYSTKKEIIKEIQKNENVKR